LTEAGDHYSAAGPVTPLAIPASLQASLLARLDRLAPVREVAQIGATLGRQFSHELIGAVAQMPPRELDEALAQLVGAELIYRRGIPPDAEYTFKHALVQDAAYSTLLRSRRQQLHARIAAALESHFPEIVAAQPALLAHHCAEAGLTEKAVEYWLAAGRHAWGRSMIAEAVALLRRGLALVPSLPDGDWRRECEFDLQIAFGQTLTALRSFTAPEVGEAYARARQLAAMLNRSRELLFALWGQWSYDVCRADLKRARQLAAEMRDLGETAADAAATQVMSYRASGITCLHLGEFTAGWTYLRQSLALYDPAHRLLYAEVDPQDVLVHVSSYSSVVLVCLGHIDQALSRRDAALEEARRLSHPLTLVHPLGLGFITGWSIRSDPKSLLQRADELLAFSVERELGLFRALALMDRGWCLAALGYADEGIRLLATGIADAYTTGFLIERPLGLTLLSDACRMAGQLPGALLHLGEALRVAEETEERWCQAETLRLRGDVLLSTGDPAAAEASYHEAIAIAQQQSAKLWELRAAASLARRWRDRGRCNEARELLAPVYGWFTEGFDTPVLQDAKALLDELI